MVFQSAIRNMIKLKLFLKFLNSRSTMIRTCDIVVVSETL